MGGSESPKEAQPGAVSPTRTSEERLQKSVAFVVSPNTSNAAENRRRHHLAKRIQTVWLKQFHKRGAQPQDQPSYIHDVNKQHEEGGETPLREPEEHPEAVIDDTSTESPQVSVEHGMLTQLYEQTRKEAERRFEDMNETSAAPHERYEQLMKIRRRLQQLQRSSVQSLFMSKRRFGELDALLSQCETLSETIMSSSLDKALVPDLHEQVAPELCLKQKLQRLLQVAVTKGVDLKTAFKHFDRDGNGTISRIEMHKGIRELGEQFQDLSPAEIDLLLDRFDLDENGEVDYQAFLEFVMTKKYNSIERKLANLLVDIDVACLRESIKSADKDSDGKLSIEQFKEALGEHLSADESEQAFECFAHGSDRLSTKRFNSFVQALHAARRSASYHGLLSGIKLTDNKEVAMKAQAAHEEMLQRSSEGGKWWEVQCNNRLYDIRNVRPKPPWTDKSCLVETSSVEDSVSDREASIVWTTYAAQDKCDPSDILNQRQNGSATERAKLYFEAIERETQRLVDRVRSKAAKQ